MDQVVINSKQNVQRIMEEAATKRKKREVYKMIDRQDSLFGLPFISKDKSPSFKNLLEGSTPRLSLNMVTASKNMSMPPGLTIPESEDKPQPSASQPSLIKV